MDKVAAGCLRDGDVTNAANMYSTLENMDPRFSRMARLCRVLCDPNSVPLPHRHNDVCEALLDPHMTAEILVGSDLSLEAIQKKYQRLVILVHPDKNPNSRAKEAFLRLATMREEAKDCLNRKLEARAQQEERAERERRELKRKGKSVDGAVIPNLSELKSNKITLKSLKRKEIEDDFEIFANGNFSRRERYNPFDIDGDDIEGESNLASTVPTSKKPKKSRGSRAATNAAGFSSLNGKPIPKKKVDLDKALEEARQYLKEEDELQQRIAEAKRQEEEKKKKDEAEGNDDLLRIREQITSLIDNLGERRQQKVHLNTDMSYESYQREKKMGPKPQAFVVVPL